MKRALKYIISLFMLSACGGEQGKEFVWNEQVAELTGKNLGGWLRQAPFENELKQQEEGVIVMTNAHEVFPFMGRYYNVLGELRANGASHDADADIYQQTEVLFQDPAWGDLFLSATLLYDDQEVFLSDMYVRAGGNPAFSGTTTLGAVDTHLARLYETSVFAKRPEYKTGIYRARSEAGNYLLGFYQQGQLVFETAIPVPKGDPLAALDKLKEVNRKLGLNVSEWESATVEQLQPIDEPKTFWEDPFTGIYRGRYLVHEVHLKTKDTPFVQSRSGPEGDHYFSYESPDGLVEFYTVLQKTESSEVDFNKAHQEMRGYEFSRRHVFYDETPEAGYVSGTAKTYFKDGQYLEIHYRYPETDNEAKEHVHGILRYIKANRY